VLVDVASNICQALPKVRPWRFSTDASTVNWKMLGVVMEEKVMALV